MRIALGLEYLGANYNGWQSQPHHDLLTVQASVEAALSKVADEKITITCAGRTDSGVHALSQVIHFDTGVERSERSWILGANSHLSKDIAANWACFVDEEFHARFSALKRTYHYYIYNGATRPAVWHQHATWCRHTLDAEKMHEAAQHLLGEQDFSSFRSSECQSHSPMRHVDQVSVSRSGDMVLFEIRANAFLHHMVRNIIGSLFVIGEAKAPQEWLLELLNKRDRKAAGATAPANGLYLVDVEYPESFNLPKKALVLPFNGL